MRQPLLSSDTGALLLGDTTVLHRAGRWLVSQEISADGASPARLSPMTFFFELDAAVTRLTAMCVSENRKFIALCEACDQLINLKGIAPAAPPEPKPWRSPEPDTAPPGSVSCRQAP